MDSETYGEYEITVELPNGDWSYRRAMRTFHGACVAGLSDAEAHKGKLIRVELLPIKNT